MSWLPDWLTGFDAKNAQRAADADAQLRALNAAAIAAGKYNQAQIDAINHDYATQVTFGVDAQRAEIDQAFLDGLGEGRDKVKSFFNGAVWEFLKSIPFVVWIGLGVGLFVWLGGLTLLKGRLARR